MSAIRRAEPGDAVGIANVHVGAWRSAYAGLLPDAFLTRMSTLRQAVRYESAISAGQPVYVAEVDRRVVGFVTASRAQSRLGDGEIETLYVLDDWRERGLGRGLMQRAAGRLARTGCRSAFLWVLRDNPSKWFYQHLGGRRVADSHVYVAGQSIPQTAYVWDPIDQLLATSAQS